MIATIAVDVGGTQIRVATYGEQGITPIQQARIPTRGEKGTPLERLIDLIASLWPTDGTVGGIGVAVPGPVNPAAGMLYSAPNIPGWVNFPLRKLLEDRFGVPIHLGNDANLAALGECKFGAGMGYHDVLYLTVSTGIGGGVILDDRLLLGSHGLAAELGHVSVLPDGPLCGCGQRGHLESLASGTAIGRYVAEQLAAGRISMLAGPNPGGKEISKAARAGDELALEAFQRAGRYLGMGIATFLHAFNPAIVIIGGGVSQSMDLLRPTLEAAMRGSVMDPIFLEDLVLTTAALKDDAGLLGALALARAPQQEMI